jgi:uncharacterized protein DUF1420
MATLDVAAQHFIQMRDLLLPPPFPALMSLLLVIGILHLSLRGARWLAGGNARPVEYAAIFVLTTGLCAALLHALAWSGYASIPVLRGIGWVLVALAPFEIRRWRLAPAREVIREHFHGASWTERLGLAISMVILLALFCAVLGPATDADSLEYHLGVPLDWLRNAGAYARPDWFHARLAGLGEAINMLGLAMGTDNLGAVFQAAGLIVAMIGVTALATTRSARIFGTLCVAACPVIVTLITAQKWQMFPAAGLTIALILLVDRARRFDYKTALLVFGCAAFAAGCKYSFLLSSGVVVLCGLLVAYRAGRLLTALLVVSACSACIAAPVFARNLVFYGDPLSPLLEHWKSGGDPAVIAFARYLREYGGQVSWQTFLFLPWTLAISLRPGTFQDVLGIGVFVFLLLFRHGDGPQRLVAMAALAVFMLDLAFSQLIPRFFLEPYLWCAAVAVPVPASRLKSLFVRACTAQGALVAAVAVYLGVLLFSGALTQTWRDRVMTVMADGYSAAKWLDAVLPRDAVVLENFRYRALMPRRFVVGDRYLIGKGPHQEQSLREFIREQKVTVLVTQYPFKESLYKTLASHYGVPLAGPAQFRAAARNVFNRGNVTGWIAIGFKEAVLPAGSAARF